jgi:LemA protein
MQIPSVVLLTVISLTLLPGCGLQSIPTALNETEAGWAEVQNQYQRRADLIPNLVSTVKGYAQQERETLEAVVTARASATQIKLDAKDLTAENLKRYEAAQSQLKGSLSRLMLVAEKYPDLKSNQNFLDLQAQLEGTENRITVARQRYIESVKRFNNLVSVFPTNLTNSLLFKYEKKPQFETAPANAEPPKVEF